MNAGDLFAPAISPLVNIPTLVCDARSGQTFVNRAKYAQKIYMLSNGPTNPTTIAANGSARVSVTPPADQGGEGDTEIYYLNSRSTGQYAVSMVLAALNRRLSNQPVESSLIFGNPNLTSRLMSPLFVPATTSLDLELTDLSGNSNSVYVSCLGHQIVDPMATLGVSNAERQRLLLDRNKHPYWLTTDSGSQVTVPTTTTSFTMTVPSVADFNAWGLLCRTTGDFTIQIYEGNRRRLLDRAMSIYDVAATTRSVTGFQDNLIPAAGLPLIFPFTHLFQRGTAITVELTSTSGNRTASLAWAGELVYYTPADPRLTMPRIPSSRFAMQPMG